MEMKHSYVYFLIFWNNYKNMKGEIGKHMNTKT